MLLICFHHVQKLYESGVVVRWETYFVNIFLQTYNKKIQVFGVTIILHDITRNYGVLNFAHVFLSFCEPKFQSWKKP